MTYHRKDVDAAEQRIREAVPDVRTYRGHYGFGLEVARPGSTVSMIVFQPERQDREQEEIVTDVDWVIEWLQLSGPEGK